MLGDPEASARQTNKRRSHRKSRLGCLICKQRRIKCDERQPTCTNCANRSLHCDYQPRSFTSAKQQQQQRSAPTRGSGVSTSPTASASSAGSASSLSAPRAPETCAVHGSPRDIHFYSWADTELMHYYTTTVAPDTAVGKKSANFWQTTLPRMAFQDAGLLHLTLAFAASHAAVYAPRHGLDARNESRRHFDAALTTVIPALSHLTPANRNTLHTAAVLICICFFAKGPRPGDFVAFSAAGPSQWFSLLRGVKALATVARGRPADLPVLVDACAYSCDDEDAAASLRRPPVLLAYRQHFRRLRDLVGIIADSSGTADVCAPALALLEEGFDARLDLYSAACAAVERTHANLIFAWLFRVSDEYIAVLQARRPLALLVFAYYAALMTDFQVRWLFGRWPAHILDGIEGYLPERYRDWLEWPRECIRKGTVCTCGRDSLANTARYDMLEAGEEEVLAEDWREGDAPAN